MKIGIYNIFFRGMTLVSKFLFILFLGKFSVDELNLGIFGMISTAVALLIYVIGFDFYTFNTREIITSKGSYTEKLKNQLVFHLITYLVFIPISFFFFFKFDFIPVEYLWILLALLISEHLGQEFYRLFTTIEKSVIANIMLFMRSGLWVWYVLFDFFILKNPMNLYKYIVAWTIFSWGSFLVFFLLLAKIVKLGSTFYNPPDWKWIICGIKTAGVFFVSSLSFQIIQFSDRFMIDFFYDKKMVGIYTTYAQFTNAIDVFTFSAITMVAYPKLIKSYTNASKYESIKRKFSKELIGLTIILILIVLVIAPLIFNFLEKDNIIKEIQAFYILLGGVFLLIVSNIFHYDLYVKGKDTYIVKVALAGMIINVLLNIILIPKYDIKGAALATLFSFFVIFTMKCCFSIQNTKNDSNRFN